MTIQYDLSAVIKPEKGEISVSGVIIPELKINLDIHESFVIVSRKEFETYLKRYKASVKALPDDAPYLCEVPLSNDEPGYVIRYYKGALMLDHFRSILGDEPFFALCREFYRTFCKKSVETAQFRHFWSEKLSDHTDVLERWITAGVRTPGTMKVQPVNHPAI